MEEPIRKKIIKKNFIKQWFFQIKFWWMFWKMCFSNVQSTIFANFLEEFINFLNIANLVCFSFNGALIEGFISSFLSIFM